MNNKSLIALAVAIIIAFFVAYLCYEKYYNNTSTGSKTTEICIFSIVEIDPIVQLRNGFKTKILESDYARKNKVIFSEYNAQGDNTLINQNIDVILSKKNKPAIIYVLGTPIAQAIQKRDPSVIVIQGAVTDPIEAGLALSWDGSGRNYAATTDLPPIDKQVNLIQQLTPSVKRLGIIYNPGEMNSVAVVTRLRKYISEKKVNLILSERPISNTSEVSSVMQTMVGNIDAIYLPPDNTAFSAINVISKTCNDNKIPLFTSASSDVTVLATLSLDYKALGSESAEITLDILNGNKKPDEIPIKPNANPKIIINEKIANDLGLDINKIKTVPNVEIK